MLELDALRQVLQTKAIAAAAAITPAPIPMQIGEEDFTPDNQDIYGQFWFRTGKSTIMELGPLTGYECTPGILQFTLFSPEKGGDGPVLRIAGQLKHLFNRQRWPVPPDGYVNLEAVGIQEIPGIRNGHKNVVVEAGFDFFHYNPDALPVGGF